MGIDVGDSVVVSNGIDVGLIVEDVGDVVVIRVGGGTGLVVGENDTGGTLVGVSVG